MIARNSINLEHLHQRHVENIKNLTDQTIEYNVLKRNTESKNVQIQYLEEMDATQKQTIEQLQNQMIKEIEDKETFHYQLLNEKVTSEGQQASLNDLSFLKRDLDMKLEGELRLNNVLRSEMTMLTQVFDKYKESMRDQQIGFEKMKADNYDQSNKILQLEEHIRITKSLLLNTNQHLS